ncbi:hypothetical protein [Bacillus seohaeanensis]|uniref:Uncharacterized protein n=1 Tax=Bacillus seohaeanensis TaxID=284580 RepID=A0ABW5RU00_9BACI
MIMFIKRKAEAAWSGETSIFGKTEEGALCPHLFYRKRPRAPSRCSWTKRKAEAAWSGETSFFGKPISKSVVNSSKV